MCNAFATPRVDRNMPIYPNEIICWGLKVTDLERQERQGEILALAKMMQYAGGVASELNASQAVFLIKAAQAALLSLLETEFPMLSGEHLNELVGDAHGHC